MASFAERRDESEQVRKDPSFRSSTRFELRRKLGEGGMGVVYEAFDRERGELVAVKTMTRVDPSSVRLFKQEFRALADVVHPNLVGLHSLVTVDEELLLTMEIVEGVNFLQYVRGHGGDGLSQPDLSDVGTAPTMLPSRVVASAAEVTLAPEDVAKGDGLSSNEVAFDPSKPRIALRLPLNADRLKRSLAQLVAGLEHLHTAGKLHRDIKPSNVLVTKGGRTVLLDFGLVTDLKRKGEAPGEVAGTPAYMAPEQMSTRALGPASDWYAVGVMLYEALTGCLPFPEEDGGWSRAMRMKQMFDPPPPDELAPDVDPLLSELAMGLLRREPEQRFTGRDVLRMTGENPSKESANETKAVPATAIWGRARHLAAIQDAHQQARAGNAVIVYVHAVSGMGKSTVVRSFLDGVIDEGSAVVLEGRCYERESVPYKALDSLVDALSQYLGRLRTVDAQALLPRYTDALARLFPVLQTVPSVAAAPKASRDVMDPLELRRRGSLALRELFARMADRGPVLLSIDDLQWGDLDSAILLAELFEEPDPPCVLLVASYRDDAKSMTATLDMLPKAGSKNVIDLPIEPLSDTDALALVESELGRKDPAAAQLARVIVRESKGNPFFLHEFVRTVQETAPDLEAKEGLPWEGLQALDDLLAARVARLAPEARSLLETVAVAGRPIGLQTAKRAAEVESEDNAPVAVLRAGNFVRMHNRGEGKEEIEPFHDRVRETVVSRLDSALSVARHRAVALALEAGNEADPEALAELFRGANEAERAADYAVLAADDARRALAFDRAAKLYRLAIEQRPKDHASRHALWESLADTLANAGRSAEAGEAFEAASKLEGATDALDLRRRAGEQFLASGHVDRGAALLGEVLDAVGIRNPKTPLGALFYLVLCRVWLRLRGYNYVERKEAELPVSDLRRVDLCFAAAMGLAMVDNVRGAYFNALSLVLALRTGEPYRVSRALATEIGFHATRGKAGIPTAQKLVPIAKDIAKRTGNPHAIGLATMTEGMTHYLVGEWKRGYELITAGESILRERCSGVVAERYSSVLYALRSLVYLGQVGRVRAELPGYLEEAADRGSLFFTTYLRLRYGFLEGLAEDDPKAARATVEAGLMRWTKRGFHIQHYLDVFAKGEIDLYEGNGRSAFDRLQGRMPFIKKNMLMQIQHFRVEILFLRAKSALTVAAKMEPGGKRDAFIRSAASDAKLLKEQGIAWSVALSELTTGCVELVTGQREAALATLDRAATLLDAADMRLHAAGARRIRGKTLGEAGQTLVDEADALARSESIKNPERWMRLVVGDFA